MVRRLVLRRLETVILALMRLLVVLAVLLVRVMDLVLVQDLERILAIPLEQVSLVIKIITVIMVMLRILEILESLAIKLIRVIHLNQEIRPIRVNHPSKVEIRIPVAKLAVSLPVVRHLADSLPARKIMLVIRLLVIRLALRHQELSHLELSPPVDSLLKVSLPVRMLLLENR